MTAKKDDTCGAGSAITDELAPLRKWEGGMSSGGYTSGPGHLDRIDFSEPAAETPSEADADPEADPDDDAGATEDAG